MRKLNLLSALMLGLTLSSCGNAEWEYKTIAISETSHKNESLQDYLERDMTEQSPLWNNFSTDDIDSQLNNLGKDGWELVTSYTNVETRFPNFGEEKYHTGIKENVRTREVCFVLKRKVK